MLVSHWSPAYNTFSSRPVAYSASQLPWSALLPSLEAISVFLSLEYYYACYGFLGPLKRALTTLDTCESVTSSNLMVFG